jgi:hypothetical protein
VPMRDGSSAHADTTHRRQSRKAPDGSPDQGAQGPRRRAHLPGKSTKVVRLLTHPCFERTKFGKPRDEQAILTAWTGGGEPVRVLRALSVRRRRCVPRYWPVFRTGNGCGTRRQSSTMHTARSGTSGRNRRDDFF